MIDTGRLQNKGEIVELNEKQLYDIITSYNGKVEVEKLNINLIDIGLVISRHTFTVSFKHTEHLVNLANYNHNLHYYIPIGEFKPNFINTIKLRLKFWKYNTYPFHICIILNILAIIININTAFIIPLNILSIISIIRIPSFKSKTNLIVPKTPNLINLIRTIKLNKVKL